MKAITDRISNFFLHKSVANLLFWGINDLLLIYIILVSFIGLVGWLFSGNSTSLTIPLNLAVIIYVFILLPIVSAFVGKSSLFKTNPKKLLYFLFGFELPLIIFTIFRFITLAELSPVMWVLIISISLGFLGFLVILMDFKPKSVVLNVLLFLSQEILILVALYFSILMAFFIPPILVGFIRGLFNALLFEDIYRNISYLFDSIVASYGLALILIILCLIFAFIVISALVIIISIPYICLFIYWNTSKETYNELIQHKSKPMITNIAYGFIFTFILLVFTMSYQDNSEWYKDTLTKINQQHTFEERQPYIENLMKQGKRLKDSLIYNYKITERYKMDSNTAFLADIYIEILNYPDDAAVFIQELFNSLAFPFIYQGHIYRLEEHAAYSYQQIFEKNIQTDIPSKQYSNNMSQSDLTFSKKKPVRIVSRVIKVKSTADSSLVNVSVDEEFQNKEYTMQELVYVFNLKPGDIITSLRLGPKLEYTGIISPKAAARSVYEQQIFRRIDPALLEQSGPFQYRLRIFPIPPKNSSLSGSKIPNQKIRFEYVTTKSAGNITLPVITQMINVGLDNNTKISYFINNTPIKNLQNKIVSAIPIKNNNKQSLAAQYTMINDYFVYFIPHRLINNNHPKEISKRKIALLLDVSYSTKNLNWYKYLTQGNLFKKFAELNRVDAYFFNYELSKGIGLYSINDFNKLSQVTNYGQTDRLKAIHSLPQGYDLAIMLTDSAEEVEEHNKKNWTKLPFPVYIVYSDNIIPSYSDSMTYELAQNGGSVFNNLSEAIKQYNLLNENALSLPSGAKLLGVDDNGVWISSHSPLEGISTTIEKNKNLSNTFISIAAAKLINFMIKDSNTEDIKNLDNIHSLAKKFSVITPYSSLIALVDEDQFQQLLEAESQEDRYKASESHYDRSVYNNTTVGRHEIGELAILPFNIMPRFTNLTAASSSSINASLQQQETALRNSIANDATLANQAPSINISGYNNSIDSESPKKQAEMKVGIFFLLLALLTIAIFLFRSRRFKAFIKTKAQNFIKKTP